MPDKPTRPLKPLTEPQARALAQALADERNDNLEYVVGECLGRAGLFDPERFVILTDVARMT